jgi:hypothetical protein
MAVTYCTKHDSLYTSWCTDCGNDERRESLKVADVMATKIDGFAAALEKCAKPYFGIYAPLDAQEVRDAMGQMLAARALYMVTRNPK